MQPLQIKDRAIKFIQHRQAAKSQNKKRVGDCVNKSKNCVECGDHVPVYQKFYCEKCWGEALNAKLEADDARENISNQDKRNKN